MISILPQDLSTAKLHGYLLGAVSPRPVAFASTIDKKGNVNLSPFSFFNVFSAKPPILVFSPARRGRDNTTKHSYENVLEVPEVVINIVSFDMVQQTSLASTEYAKGINEFKKAGFTELSSDIVKPPRVAEAPVQLECKVNDVISLGKEGGAGNLVICEVVKLHIKEDVLDENGAIDPFKIDTISRLGGNWYSRAKEGLFEVAKPLTTLGVGVDALPEEVRYSKILTGNDLGVLGNVEDFPNSEEINTFIGASEELKGIANSGNVDIIHKKAQEFLNKGEVEKAWKLLLGSKNDG
ncbi:flavin reductase family protein [Aequorivita viscosa]|uniref:NADH-FMN oxidoreductase RutF, flavin reductase (DIM6/NTAB) family n=1 Tax=Aequorivita viscosa TaxID=797419 RepID=A0A1M6L8R5_9FLAO|nr:flavin reductase family protein [Aequorivita viscosa]SDX22280.1 NADH-FMN oxidoreductase RutF, flavin reductase (DIM6/NTAB) family [Aequorivita viscosa]SHJ67553.1 NADH-FMN oxidoreductase RutF, flavin reductase (DIM6/NTAB) family [Aequorivita viscosa]